MLSKFVKNILGSKKTKRVFYVLMFLVVGYSVFSIGADCFAEGAIMDAHTRMTNFNTIASEIIKCLYVLLWPLIFVCGIALDNSLVYGEWLHLDAPLRSMWNIMKNIANFALGGLVLYAILRNLVAAVGKGNDKWGPLNVIKNTLVAGILIQMSRFLVGAVLSISTLLTYAVGGLPMTVLKQNPNYANRPVMSLSINAGSDIKGVSTEIYYTYGDHRVSDCLVRNDLPISGSYIIGPKIAYLWDFYNNSGFYMDTGYCTVGGWPYRYNYLLSGEDGGIYPDIYAISDTGALKNKTYQTTLSLMNLETEGLEASLNNCTIIPVDDLKLSSGCKSQHYGSLPLDGNDEFFLGQDSDNTILYTVDTLIEQSKGFVGPLVTIYSSLLDIQSFVDDSTTPPVETFISLLFKFVFFVALIAPLIGLAIILIVRIGMLWILIATAPVLILVWTFGDLLGPVYDLVKDKFSLGNMIKLIFAPVIVTLAISLSLIFINAVSGIKGNGAQREEVFETLGIQTDPNNMDTYSILGLVEIEMDTTLIGKGKDDFAYFITYVFAIAIIRYMLIAALKMCGGVGEKVGKFMGENFEQMMTNVPIVPLPSGGAVGLQTLNEIPQELTNKIVTPMQNISRQNMRESFKWLYPDVSQGSVAKGIVEKIKKGQLETLTSAQVSIMEPIFKTNDGTKIVETVKHMDQEDINKLVENYDTYKSENFEQSETTITEEGAKIGPTKTSADALKLTQSQLDVAVQNDETWISRAEGMIGGAVHTQDGVYIVDIIPGTEQNPVYRIVDRDTYETAHFGNPIANVSKEEFETRKSEDQHNLAEYLGKLAESDKKLKELENKDKEERTEDETKQLDQLDKFFTDKMRKELDKFGLVDHGFTKTKEEKQGEGD